MALRWVQRRPGRAGVAVLAAAALLALACQRSEPELRVTYYYLRL